jgi:ribonuclease T1
MIGLSVWVAHTGAAAWQVPSLFSQPSELKAATLPVQAQEVLAQIHSGGPFRFEKDGTVFGNRERLLPRQSRGFYREYTVPTPGLSHRGARRIVCGGWQPQRPDACYYSADHYASFKMIER